MKDNEHDVEEEEEDVDDDDQCCIPCTLPFVCSYQHGPFLNLSHEESAFEFKVFYGGKA